MAPFDVLQESAIDSDYIVTVLNLLSKLYQEAEIRPKTKRRQLNRRPSVELGPGTIKSPILKYPEKYFEKKLKHLIKLQKQQEERNKDLNSLCWFLIQNIIILAYSSPLLGIGLPQRVQLRIARPLSRRYHG
ncbi:hypothetical protein MSG28_013023 [Choristoneura fumiferana]|uniref:Uncharacterized protein n=1 Tax=Choristoneura fumiferana TaxID=7141 RepID=A0ACC0KSN3_CHOFU|nr:hypothetical protein MSG28_013023 [Choristoneura fumiferana]